MLKIMIRICLVLFVMLPMATDVPAQVARNLSPVEASRLIQQRAGELFLLDVRTPSEYGQVRLSGARLIPIDQLLARMREVPREKPILVYCAVGSRSAQVVAYMARNGFPEVYNLYGGIWAWEKKGLPVLKGLP